MAVVTTQEWLEQIRARPIVEPARPRNTSVTPVKRKPGRPKGTPNPPRPQEPKTRLPRPVEHRLAPDVVAWTDPYIEIPDRPVPGLRHIHVEAASMGGAARKGLQNARDFWKWLDVQSVAGIEAAGSGWTVTLRIADDLNPYLRRRWRFDWYS